MLRDLEKREPALSPTNIRYVYVVLRIALGRALKLGKAYRNVATLIDPPAKGRRDRQPTSGGRAARSALAGRGPRRPRWSVRHTLQQDARTLAEPKTDRSVRTISLECCHRGGSSPAPPPSGRGAARGRSPLARRHFVFTSGVGTPLDHRNVLRHYHAASRACRHPESALPPAPPRLRHAAARERRGAGEHQQAAGSLEPRHDGRLLRPPYAGYQPAAADRMGAILTG